jgi:hypothetical protein
VGQVCAVNVLQQNQAQSRYRVESDLEVPVIHPTSVDPYRFHIEMSRKSRTDRGLASSWRSVQQVTFAVWVARRYVKPFRAWVEKECRILNYGA